MSKEKKTDVEGVSDVAIAPPPRKVLTEDYKKKMISNATYHLTEQEKFYGSLLQELTLWYHEGVPTAGISYNVKKSQYEIYVNPYFFDSCTPPERVGVFQHEILHFTNKHLFRFPFLKDKTSEEDRRLYNIAGDMAINQFIKHLPKGVVDVADWKMDDGSAFPKFKTMEQYHELIKEEKKKQDEKNEDKKKGKGNGSKGNVPEKLAGYEPFDTHEWDDLDEETKKKMLDEAKKLIKRTMDKTSTSYTKIPDGIKDLLEEIDKLSSGLNYKTILRNVIKKTVSCVDRESTWKKPNRRYGVVSPGTKVGNLPMCSFYLDTSGSISIVELNLFLNIMSGFLKVGARQCQLGLWHTALYYKKKYKLNGQLDRSEVESGGTDVGPALEDIKKTNPNLAIILTDGCYSAHEIKIAGEVIWIISEGGQYDHPMKHLGKTIKLADLR